MRIVLPCIPTSKARPRVGRNDVYDSQKKLVQLQKWKLKEIYDVSPDDFKSLYSSQLKVSLSYLMPIPASSSQAQRNAKLWGCVNPSSVDLDNLIKWTLDLGNKILWNDDCQICKISASMHFSDFPCTIIEYESINLTMSEDAKLITKYFSPKDILEFESMISLINYHLSMVTEVDDCGNRQVIMDEDLSQLSYKIIDFSKKFGDRLKKIAGGK